MVESDDEFAELCSKLLKRVKKNSNNPLESQNAPKPSTAARGKLKRTKPSGAKKQKKDEGSREEEVDVTTGPAKPEVHTEEKRLAVQSHLPNGLPQNASGRLNCQEGDTGPPNQMSVKDLVLERMQQFKRAAPSRMKLESTETNEVHVVSSKECQSVQSDGDLALALQMDVKEKPASLEDEGLFFCQLCQKDLTAMSSTLREQHVNRCLDQIEGIGGNSVIPAVPSCPLCGKPFSTEKSRASHLKRCAVKLDVPAQTLLQAVQRQAAEAASEAPSRVVNGKRKGGTKQKEPSKKRKVAQTGAEVEDLLVAMALSRSMQEEKNAQNTAAGPPPPEMPSREKKSRRKQKDKPTPLLLAQAPEETAGKLQKRLSMLLTEEAVENNVMMLPPSLFWIMEEEDRKIWKLRGGKRCVFWDISNMMETRNTLSYYTAELSPSITPWKSPLKLHNSQTHVNTTISYPGKPKSQTADDKDPVSCEEKNPLSDSQKALLDLAELAGDGMTLTQWNSGAGIFNERTGRESPVSITSSGFIPAQEEKVSNDGGAPNNMTPLLVLSADFMEMVNNPHLSDAQLQTDCGEVLSAHMFVLYARCPLLVEAIHSEGFWVDESGMGRARRLLLNDVSAEAALCFLRFVYSATTDIPDHCLPHVCELARRFGVKSLIDTCELLVSGTHNAEGERSTEEEGDDGGERAETFQELLKSMWMDEGQDVFEDLQADGESEEKLVDGGVGEGELAEIYEFALTQRKILAEQDSKDGDESNAKFGYGEESEDRSPKFRNQNLEEEEEMDFITTTPLKVSPNPKDLDCSPRKSPAFLPSNSPEYSVTSAQLKMQPSSSSSLAPAQSPSKLSVPGASPTKVITSHNSSSSESPIPVISLLSPNRDEDPEAPHTPPPIDDSYNRMFSQTCGIYEETSGISESKSQINPASPQDQQPILTSSPTAVPSPALPELGSSPNIQPLTHSFLDRPSSSTEQDKSLLSSFKTSHSCTPTQNSKDGSSKASCQDADIILILSSDEEMESSDRASAPSRSGQFDIPDICKAIKESPVSFTRNRKSSEGFSHLEMSSSSEMSWLVPATPLYQTAGSKVSVLQTSCIPQSPQTSQRTPHATQSPPNSQEMSHAAQSLEISQKTSHTAHSTPNSQKMSPPDSQKTPQSSQASRNFDLDVSCQSFVSQTQATSVSLPLLSPKSPRTPRSLKPSIQEKPETRPEGQSSVCSKTPSTPPASIASSTVFEVVDSEDEAPVAEPLANISNSSFQFDYDEPPIPMEEDLWCNLHETPRKLYSSPIPSTPLHLNETPTKPSNCKTNSPSPAKSTTPTSIEGSPQVFQRSCQSYLNSKLWEDEEPELPVVLPLTQRLMEVPEVQKELRTPVSIVRKRELVPKVPITPLPNYSDMDTPILKNELTKFGVRALPKKKMVLKLKEIFRYTHQVMSSDSEDDVPSSQPHQSKGKNIVPTLQRPTQDKQRPQNITKGPSGSHLGRKVVCTAQETDTGDDQPLNASQESTTSSVAASDASSLSQSSNTNEFEMAFADEDDDEPLAASQAASKDALTAEAVRRFIEARPDLHKRILLYQPLDLATLHAEIKQSGIKIAAGKLLDFLDSHCITFTTAAARKEKKSRRRMKAAKRY
ncbi:structure-specific endonuclease subunit SLX4 isoform X2 [Eleutherodactylus coqui]|uniref:structure-specific endonuclease subunit SLX4 isoform X2 n=1 Tax=Eleutherodactylus coqui TaxID=57060 RepID=UPI0034631BAB